MAIREVQAQRLGLKPYSQLSPLLEKCCLRLSANESYQSAESEITALMGVKVSHSTLQRLVQRTEFDLPDAKQKVNEVSFDGGKVRLRHEQKGQPSYWLEYKSARVAGIYYGAAFRDNPLLLDWVNTQYLCDPLVCLGDGHDGVWKFFSEVGGSTQRLEILDWYHLKENLYKVGGSRRRLRQAEVLLWKGLVEPAQKLFVDCQLDQARKFRQYLENHHDRIVNYQYFQSEGLTIGSGAVESSIKQIDRRLKISGAQWQPENVPQALQLRCAYLNGLLAV